MGAVMSCRCSRTRRLMSMPGELVAVLAQRAQGKTTLLRVAAGMDRPGRGEVLFKGEDLYRLSDRRRSALLRQHIGFAEPVGPDIDLPVLAHVAVPLLASLSKKDAYERARVALERVGARNAPISRGGVLLTPSVLSLRLRRRSCGDLNCCW